MSGYVDLNRSFVSVADDAEPELAIGQLWGRKYGGWLAWPDVLNHPRVVLLAEAQSGKTEEFKHTTAELRDRGTPAFYATIEQLAEGRLNLSPPQRALFEAWKAGADRGWFFLDSVDEARLNRKKFDDALLYLGAEIGAALVRANILVSCRVSDWKGKSDRQTILDNLPVPPPPPPPTPPPAADPDVALLDPIFERDVPEKSKGTEKTEKKPEDLLVIRLVPLTDEQRRAFALAKGIRDVDAFMAAIDQQGLDVLAERPGDMLDLIQYWADHKRFGTLTTMTEAAVVAKLREPDRYRPDNTDLPPAKAREGAERVAAALTLAKSFTLIAPGQEPDPGLASGALDPIGLLNDWNVAESNALLRRGIFAPSTYGRVRFHHRSTQEYLTACWLKRLLDGGCQLSEIFGLIFTERYGVETVAPSLRAPAAWLAHHYPDVRDEIIRREPLLLITYGDPAGLSIESKAKLLLNFARKHAVGEIADDSMDRRALGMFSSPDLSDAIHEAWKVNSRADFRHDLIRMVREGRIAGCVDLAERMAGDSKEADHSRVAAVDALVACEAVGALQRVATALMSDPSKASPRLAAGFAKALFPAYLSVTQLLALIDKAKVPADSSTDGFSYAIDELWQACPSVDKPALIARLAKLCAQPPFANEYRRVALRQAQLSRHLGNIAFEALSALGDNKPSSDLIELLAVVERAERPIRYEGEGSQLNQRVRQNRTVNRALFWHDAQEVRKNSGHAVHEHWQVHFGGAPLWALERPDLEWLRDDLKSKTLHDDRRVALSAIAWLTHPQLKAEAPALRKLIGRDAALRKELISYLRPQPASPAVRRMNEQSAKHEAERQARREVDKASWREFRDKVQANPAELSDPSKVTAGAGFLGLHNLSHWLLKKTRQDAPSAVRQWRLLEPAFSRPIAEAYRDGMKALWRVHSPESPIHKPGGATTVKWITIYAYAAIGLEAADNPRFAETLSESDTRRAIQHVSSSEQGYPDWLDGLIRVRPKIAVPLIREAFKSEWEAAEGRVSYFLYHFAQNGTEIHPDLQSAIFDVIASIEPVQINTLDRGLDIIRNLSLSETQRAALRATALARFEALKKTKVAWAARYVALLFLLGEPSAATTLTNWLRGEKSSVRTALTITVLGLLFGGHHPLIVGVLAGLSIPILSRLTLFAFQEIQPDEDNVHDGIYSPNDRDDAEHARSAILKALIESEGAAAFEAMIRLARHATMTGRRIRFRELARRMAERDADVTAWSPNEVLAFEREKILPVKTGQDLYRVVQAIIHQIGWEFANADASARAVLETAKDEEAVQQWLAAEIKQRARGRYHASRESEVAEGNMPDVLVSAIGALVEVAVEAKHGGKGWSTKALEESLRGQLAEDYLRPASRRHGIFVVTNHKKRGWQHPKTRKALSFAEMIAYLNDVAATLGKNKAGDIAVTVIGIDAVKKPRTRGTGRPNKGGAKKKQGPISHRVVSKKRRAHR